MSQLCPGAVLQKLDKLVEPLKLTCTTKVKANSVKQEYEKQDELKRSAMRAVASLMNIPGADKHPQLNEFITQIKSTPDLANLFESIQKDSGDSLTNQMDLSWGGGRRDAGKESWDFTQLLSWQEKHFFQGTVRPMGWGELTRNAKEAKV